MEEVKTPESPRALDIGKCFNDGLAVYKVNIVNLILATLIFQLLSLFSLLILAGPLYGGYCIMLLNAIRKEDKKAEIGDIFKAFNKFWFLLGLFSLQAVAIFFGFLALLIPGLLLTTMWLYTYFFMVDKNTGVMDSLKSSWNMVKGKGFWPNFAMCIIYLLMTGALAQIPAVGWILSILALPLAILALTSAYLQQAPATTAQPEEPKGPFSDAQPE